MPQQQHDHFRNTMLFLITGILFSPQNSTVSLGQNATFQCVSNTNLIVWKVDEDKIDTDRLFNDPVILEKFANQSIFISESLRNGNSYTSVLTITANERNNFTEVQCTIATAILSDLNFDGEVAFLQLLGNFMIACHK